MSSHYDFALFLHRIDKGTILLLLYVDDIIITGDDLNGFQELKDFLNQQFEMEDLGHLKTSWVLKSLILHMDFILLKPSMPLNSCLKLNSLIAKLLTL